MTISGEAGVGKSCVAVFALNYLAERHYFSDGVLYVEASSCDSVTALALALDAAIVAACGTPSHAHAVTAAALDADAPAADDEAGAAAARARSGSVGAPGSDSLAAVLAPLHMLHCLLVLDGVRPPLLRHPSFLALLGTLLSCAAGPLLPSPRPHPHRSQHLLTKPPPPSPPPSVGMRACGRASLRRSLSPHRCREAPRRSAPLASPPRPRPLSLPTALRP